MPRDRLARAAHALHGGGGVATGRGSGPCDGEAQDAGVRQRGIVASIYRRSRKRPAELRADDRGGGGRDAPALATQSGDPGEARPVARDILPRSVLDRQRRLHGPFRQRLSRMEDRARPRRQDRQDFARPGVLRARSHPALSFCLARDLSESRFLSSRSCSRPSVGFPTGSGGGSRPTRALHPPAPYATNRSATDSNELRALRLPANAGRFGITHRWCTMVQESKTEAALALHRFGLGPRAGSIAAITSDP